MTSHRSFPPTRNSCRPPCRRLKRGRPGSQPRSGRPARFRSRRRRRSAATSRNASGWILTTRGSINRRIRFPGGRRPDVRITTRYLEDDFASAILAVVHETGHALYERGLPSAYARQPVGEAAGMATHESQSLIVEMQACPLRRLPGLAWWSPACSVRRVARTLSAGEPGTALAARGARLHSGRCRRTDLSCPCDPALPTGTGDDRGRPDGRDLPGAWNDGLFALLGITPPNDAQGCLQDIHWYDGAFGYFPSYTLGAMGGRAIDGGGAGAGVGSGRGVRPRRSRAAAGVASGACTRRRKPLWLPRNPGASNGPDARSARVSDAPAAALFRSGLLTAHRR